MIEARGIAKARGIETELEARGIATKIKGGYNQVVSTRYGKNYFVDVTESITVKKKPFMSLRTLTKTISNEGKPVSIRTGATEEIFRKNLATESGRGIGKESLLVSRSVGASATKFEEAFATRMRPAQVELNKIAGERVSFGRPGNRGGFKAADNQLVLQQKQLSMKGSPGLSNVALAAAQKTASARLRGLSIMQIGKAAQLSSAQATKLVSADRISPEASLRPAFSLKPLLSNKSVQTPRVDLTALVTGKPAQKTTPGLKLTPIQGASSRQKPSPSLKDIPALKPGFATGLVPAQTVPATGVPAFSLLSGNIPVTYGSGSKKKAPDYLSELALSQSFFKKTLIGYPKTAKKGKKGKNIDIRKMVGL